MDDVKEILETTLKTKVIQALNDAPEAIEKLVQAAMSQNVDSSGQPPRYGGRGDMTFLDWLVGQEIRSAARAAVHEVFEARADEIKASVKKRFSADDIVEAFAKYLIDNANADWRITVQFEPDD